MKLLWPAASFLSGGLVRTRGPARPSTVYLTFDDGPHAEHTPRLLELLARHDANGTFFMIGEAAAQMPELVTRMHSEGHAIGNHSMTHPRMRTLARREQWAEIDRADAVLRQLDGRHKHVFRPPNGRLTMWTVAASVLRRNPLMLWTIDSLDYKLGPEEVVRQLQRARPEGGDVLLFHDDNECACRALEELLPAWKRAGLRFAALD